MLEKMDERKWKNDMSDNGKRKYKLLNNELRRETDRARERWWQEECEELERMDLEGRSDMMYAKVKSITRTGKAMAVSGTAINDENGVLLSEPVEVRNRWKEYVEDLYDKNNKPNETEVCVEMECDVEEDERGPHLLDDEIRAAIKEMKKGKAVGVDGIPAEFLKIMGEQAFGYLARICKKMYDTGIWPEDFTKVVMIPNKH